MLNANFSDICLYWNVGRAILKKQKEGWGTKVIKCMAKELKDAFMEMFGFSPRNIKYMRKLDENCLPLKLCNGSWHKYRGEPIYP